MFEKFTKPELTEIKIDTSFQPFTASADDLRTLYQVPVYPSVASTLDDIINNRIDAVREKAAQNKEDEKWIWVEGYKGVNADLTAHGNFQYEIGKTYHMDADVEVKACFRGFHFCLTLDDVFNYYTIGGGNRFFKVKALVREKDHDAYGKKDDDKGYFFGSGRLDKLAASAIILERELTLDEIFYDPDYADWTEDEKKLALAESPRTVRHNRNVARLVEAGYSEELAQWIAKDSKKRERAFLLETQPGLSMDMKVFAIMYEK